LIDKVERVESHRDELSGIWPYLLESIRYRKLLLTMTGDIAEHRSLFGVRLVSEMHLNDRAFDTCLGVIVLGAEWLQLLLPAIRLEICRQLQAVSTAFTFLTSEGFVNRMFYWSG